MMKPIVSRFTAIAVALILSACTAGAEPVISTSTPEPAPSLPASPTAASGADRYVNLDAGISLVLPEGWSAAGPYPASAGDSSYNLYLLGPDPSPNAGPGASRLIAAADDTLTLTGLLESQCSTCPSAEVTPATLNGISVQRAVIGGGGVPFEVEWVTLDHNGRLVGLSIHDPQTLETLNNVLETLRLEP
jgi:hypothetical protein